MRSVAVSAILLIAAAWLLAFISPQWSLAMTEGRSFVTDSTWWSPLHATMLVPGIVILLVAGLLFGVLTTVRRPALLGLLLGVAASAIHLALTMFWFSPAATAFEYLWVYSEYLVPPFSAMLGAAIGRGVKRRVARVA